MHMMNNNHYPDNAAGDNIELCKGTIENKKCSITESTLANTFQSMQLILLLEVDKV